jgi:hypothetical protein
MITEAYHITVKDIKLKKIKQLPLVFGLPDKLWNYKIKIRKQKKKYESKSFPYYE